MKKTILLMSVAGLGLLSCGDGQTKGESKETANPFFSEKYNTPFEVPPFDKIKDEHFLPAFQEAISQSRKEIETIANSEEAPTFANTVEAMDFSGKMLTKVSHVFYNLLGANTNPTLQEVAKTIAPELSKLSDDTYLNEKLFSRVKQIWDSKENLGLNQEQAKLLENSYKAFVRSGANLSDEDKEKLREINSQLSVLSLNFGDNVLAENNNYSLVIDKQEHLSGLPQELVEMAAAEATKRELEGKWVFTLHNPSVMPFLQYADNRELRKEIWNAYQRRGSQGGANDNSETLLKLTNLRRQKAQLLGYESHAHYGLEETMAKNPETVYKLLNQLWTPALAVAKKEEADIKAMMIADGIQDEVQPYDWRYYTEKIRKQRFDLDEQEVKPYFSLQNVQEGVFMVCKKLFGLTFKELNNIPKYHEDASAWEVFEDDGTHVGVLYMDFHPRASKRGGAWMSSFRKQEKVNGVRIAPVITIVCNFSPPTANAPALLTFDEATTFFHEFGHALHGLLSDVQYYSLSGTSVPRDFVELPSQVLENWAADPTVLKEYAKHYQTGESIPDELVAKLNNAGTFDQGFATVEYLAASLLDMDYHTNQGEIKDARQFEKQSMSKYGLPASIIPRYRSGYFNHIFSGGYSAGYYSYIWSGVLDTDAFEAFKSTGNVYHPEKAKAFRKEILEKGGTDDPMEMYKRFRGAEPSIEPLLKKRGLLQKSSVNTGKNQ